MELIQRLPLEHDESYAKRQKAYNESVEVQLKKENEELRGAITAALNFISMDLNYAAANVLKTALEQK